MCLRKGHMLRGKRGKIVSWCSNKYDILLCMMKDLGSSLAVGVQTTPDPDLKKDDTFCVTTPDQK